MVKYSDNYKLYVDAPPTTLKNAGKMIQNLNPPSISHYIVVQQAGSAQLPCLPTNPPTMHIISHHPTVHTTHAYMHHHFLNLIIIISI